MKKIILINLVLCFSGFLFAQEDVRVPGCDKGAPPESWANTNWNRTTTSQPKIIKVRNYDGHDLLAITSINLDETNSNQPETCKSGFDTLQTNTTYYMGDPSVCLVSIVCHDDGKSLPLYMRCPIEKCNYFDSLIQTGRNYKVYNVNADKCDMDMTFYETKTEPEKPKGI